MPALADVLGGFETMLSGATVSSMVGIVTGVSLIGGLVLGVITRVKTF